MRTQHGLVTPRPPAALAGGAAAGMPHKTYRHSTNRRRSFSYLLSVCYNAGLMWAYVLHVYATSKSQQATRNGQFATSNGLRWISQSLGLARWAVILHGG